MSDHSKQNRAKLDELLTGTYKGGQRKYKDVVKTATTTKGRTTTTTYTATKLKRSGEVKTVSKVKGALVKTFTKAKQTPAGRVKKKTIQVKETKQKARKLF